jgi:hypothetical protein
MTPAIVYQRTPRFLPVGVRCDAANSDKLDEHSPIPPPTARRALVCWSG